MKSASMKKMTHYKVELPLSDEAGTLFDRYSKHMREYVNDEGERPFENMTDAELFQTAMYLGSERMVREKLWEALFASHAVTAEEYRERRLS